MLAAGAAERVLVTELWCEMVRIVRFSEIGNANGLRSEIDAIFFENAVRQVFDSGDARAAYRDLWLGRYIQHFPDTFHIAFDDSGAVSGYLAGSPVSDRPPLPGPDYYQLFPHTFIDAYPAHLHVNVWRGFRGRSFGSDLVAAFQTQCREDGIPGFHAVTAAGGRAAGFFKKCGLVSCAKAEWRGHRIVFMGKRWTAASG